MSDPALFGRPIVVTNVQYCFLVAEQLAAIGAQADILLEPVRRESGPAIVAGAAYALRRGDDPLVVALAADHVVSDALAFAKECATAAQAAREDRIVMFGVEPTRPATEYGYIRRAAPLAPGLFSIERFVGKPDAATASRYVAEGYLWNSGNFVFRAGFLLNEYRRFEPESGAAGRGSNPKRGRRSRVRNAMAVMPISYSWSDVGSWQAVWELSKRDADGNAAQGKALFIDARRSYVATEKQLVSLPQMRAH